MLEAFKRSCTKSPVEDATLGLFVLPGKELCGVPCKNDLVDSEMLDFRSCVEGRAVGFAFSFTSTSVGFEIVIVVESILIHPM